MPGSIVIYLGYMVKFQDVSVRKLLKKLLITHYDLDTCFSSDLILVL